MLDGRARASASDAGVRVASRECDVIVIVLIYRSSESGTHYGVALSLCCCYDGSLWPVGR